MCISPNSALNIATPKPDLLYEEIDGSYKQELGHMWSFPHRMLWADMPLMLSNEGLPLISWQQDIFQSRSWLSFASTYKTGLRYPAMYNDSPPSVNYCLLFNIELHHCPRHICERGETNFRFFAHEWKLLKKRTIRTSLSSFDTDCHKYTELWAKCTRKVDVTPSLHRADVANSTPFSLPR